MSTEAGYWPRNPDAHVCEYGVPDPDLIGQVHYTAVACISVNGRRWRAFASHPDGMAQARRVAAQKVRRLYTEHLRSLGLMR